MLTIQPPKFQPRGARPRRIPPGPPGPMLVAATYSEGAWVRLTFDRDLADVATMNTAAVFVDDGDIGDRFQGHGTATRFAPKVVQVNVISTGPTTILDTRLTAGPDSRLMAADDSGTWAGVKNVVLPYTS